MRKIQFSMQFIVALLFVISLGCVLSEKVAYSEQTAQVADTDCGKIAVEQLSKAVVDKPTIAGTEILQVMRKAADTRRVDALILLIKGLAYHHDPINTNEVLSPEEMISSIQIINNTYGIQSLPYLYTEGINTNKQWMRERCALAIRSIASSKEIKAYNTTYSLKETNNVNGRAFYTLLTAEKLEISFVIEPVDIQLPKRDGD